MAEAVTEIVRKQKTITVDEEVFVLTLSREEAETLTSALANIAGDVDKSNRKFAASISTALYNLGFDWNARPCTGTLQFPDWSE